LIRYFSASVVVLLVLLILTGCTCSSTRFRSCGDFKEDWGVSRVIEGDLMIVTIERLPTGKWEITARRNGLNGDEVLARRTVIVARKPSARVEVTLEPVPGAEMANDAFVVVKKAKSGANPLLPGAVE